MFRRLFIVASALSLLLCVVCVLLWILSVHRSDELDKGDAYHSYHLISSAGQFLIFYEDYSALRTMGIAPTPPMPWRYSSSPGVQHFLMGTGNRVNRHGFAIDGVNPCRCVLVAADSILSRRLSEERRFCNSRIGLPHCYSRLYRHGGLWPHAAERRAAGLRRIDADPAGMTLAPAGTAALSVGRRPSRKQRARHMMRRLSTLASWLSPLLSAAIIAIWVRIN